MLILKTVKTILGVKENNLGFDEELLIYINAAGSILSNHGIQLGLVGADTEFPSEFSDDLVGFLKPYLALKVKMLFDPSASENITTIFEKNLTEIESRMISLVEKEPVL